MDELDNRNSSLQRKKPPWLKLDIPVIQLTPDEPPTLKQVREKIYSQNNKQYLLLVTIFDPVKYY